MVVMASARDLITIFVALETLSIPAYMLAGWRKRDLKSNEASLKYYLLGVLASAVMLYGMSLMYGVTGTHRAHRHRRADRRFGHGRAGRSPSASSSCIVGFAFKVSAVPFHYWAPDTYEGAPTPVTAFLSVASKAAGFVAIIQLVFIGFFGREDVWEPLFWVLAAALDDGRQPHRAAPDEHRPDAGLLVDRAGRLHARAVGRRRRRAAAALRSAVEAVVVYLLIYAAMNLGAFARGDRRGPQDPVGRDSTRSAGCSSTRPASPC